jgi:hypothetical protein
VQAVARTYYLTRDNSDGSRSQAWAGGGWIAYRSGLIADHFGVHGALYTSQSLLAPPDEGGTKLLNPEQEQISVLGQAYAFGQLGDQELRGGRTLIDTPLINPQDSRMVPNTFESVMATTLPSKSREYDYSVGCIRTFKLRHQAELHRHAAGLLRQCPRESGRSESGLQSRLCVRQVWAVWTGVRRLVAGTR